MLLDIQNVGNVTANGTITLTLYSSLTGNLDATADQLAVTEKKIAIHAGHTRQIRIHFTAPALDIAGTYDLIAATDSSTTVTDANNANDMAVIGTMPG